MQSAVMHELEGFANVQLTTKESGVWTVPPYCIDSVTFLAGFIMNCSDAMDTQNNYCVTPGWKTMRFAKPLVPGAKYRSYVKMIPTVEDPTICLGDVYIMQGYGLVGGTQFRRYPRILLSRFSQRRTRRLLKRVSPKMLLVRLDFQLQPHQKLPHQNLPHQNQSRHSLTMIRGPAA